MPTSVHIPPALLAAVDRKATALHISRNRLIIQALERDLAPSAGWSADFFDVLRTPERGVVRAVKEMQDAITGARRSKRPIRL